MLSIKLEMEEKSQEMISQNFRPLRSSVNTLALTSYDVDLKPQIVIIDDDRLF